MVAEKPSVAKMIAEHLSGGRFRLRKGQSRANQIFEFIKYFGPAQTKVKVMVTSVVGHIYGLNFEVRDTGREDCLPLVISIVFCGTVSKQLCESESGSTSCLASAIEREQDIEPTPALVFCF